MISLLVSVILLACAIGFFILGAPYLAAGSFFVSGMYFGDWVTYTMKTYARKRFIGETENQNA